MFYFRADGNSVTGAGHLMRCLTIAEELRKLPEAAEQICFVCAEEASAELVRQYHFPVKILHTDDRDLEKEIPVWEEWLKDSKEENVILADSYYVTDNYLKNLGTFGHVFLLDDMGHQSYPVEGVINYNAFAKTAHYEALYAERNTRLFIGSDFVPVRQQFLDVPYEVDEQVKNVLITTGGGDHDNIAARIFETIKQPDCCYHVVIGQFSRHFTWWKQLEKENDRVKVHHNVTDMASLMRQCDLAVTAGGTTVYELAAIGVPFLCFSYAQNQEALTEYIGRENIAGYCGAYHLDAAMTLNRMRFLAGECKSVRLRSLMHRREKEMIDGLGAGRIARLLTERSL